MADSFETVRSVPLRGLALEPDGFGSAWSVIGGAKFVEDIHLIVSGVILRDTLLRVPMTQAQRGSVAQVVKAALESPDSWWIGQPSPVEEATVRVSETGRPGEYDVRVGYVERRTGIRVDVDSDVAIVVPFAVEGV